MSRTRDDFVEAMGTAARLAPFDASGTWRDALFAGNPAHPTLSRPGEGDRALLGALGDEMAQLDAHADTVPDRLHVEWLSDLLGIPRWPYSGHGGQCGRLGELSAVPRTGSE